MKAVIYIGSLVSAILLFILFFFLRAPEKEPVHYKSTYSDKIKETQKQASYGYKEGDEVSFVSGGWGCEFKQKFDDIHRLQSIGKNVAAKDDISKAWPLCITSGRIEPGQTFTVLEIDGGYSRISTATIEQSLKAKDAGYERFSYWTSAEWLRK